MISRLRNLAVELRTPLKIREKLKKAGLRMAAILDQDTRDEAAHILCWNMSKEFINESVKLHNRGVQLTAPQWRQAQELKNILQKSHLVSKKLQLHDLTPGYFFCKMDKPAGDVFQVQDSIVAGEILKSMKKREAELLLSTTFLSLIY
jgi:hypothetical protein